MQNPSVIPIKRSVIPAGLSGNPGARCWVLTMTLVQHCTVPLDPRSKHRGDDGCLDHCKHSLVASTRFYTFCVVMNGVLQFVGHSSRWKCLISSNVTKRHSRGFKRESRRPSQAWSLGSTIERWFNRAGQHINGSTSQGI